MPPSVAHRQLFEPKNVASALRMLRDEETPVPMAGCTDLYVLLNFGTLTSTRFLSLWALDELRGIERRANVIRIGALTTFTDLIRSPLVRRELPMLARAAREVGGVQIQNAGTVAGNHRGRRRSPARSSRRDRAPDRARSRPDAYRSRRRNTASAFPAM